MFTWFKKDWPYFVMGIGLGSILTVLIKVLLRLLS